MLAAASAACEALVGITDRELAPAVDATADGATGSEGGGLDGVDAQPDSDVTVGTGPDAGLDSSTSAEAGDAVGEAGPTSDAGTDVIDDRAIPVEASEAGPGPDGSDGSDGAAPTDPDLPCSQQPTFIFCEDFDSLTTVSMLTQNWNYVYASNDGGLVLLDSTHFVSSPRSGQIIAPPVAGSVIEVQLGKTIGPLYTSVRLAFDFRLDVSTYVNLPQVGIAQLLLARPTPASSLQVNFNLGAGSNCQLDAYGVTDGGAAVAITPSLPPVKTWSRIVIVYDITAGLSLYQNGQLVGTQPAGAGIAPGNVNVIMGAAYVNPNGTATPTVELDNIVVSGH